MDLYIRSQDRLILEKYETLQLCQNPDGTWFFNSGLVLGKYSTKERALEVLDEIHSIIQTNCGFEIYSNLGKFGDGFNEKYNLVPVYQMPQE